MIKRKIQLVVLLALLVTLAGINPTNSMAAGVATWTQTNTLPDEHSGHAQSTLTDGRVLLSGGFDGAGGNNSQSYNTSWLYNPNTEQWTQAADLPAYIVGHSQSSLNDGGALLVAGSWGNAPNTGTSTTFPSTNKTLRYNATTNTWAPAANYPGGAVQYLAQSTLADGRVLVTGGWDSAYVKQSTAYIYNPTTNSWTSAANIPEGVSHHAQATLSDGKVMLVANASTYLYNPSNNTWTKVANVPISRINNTLSGLQDGRALLVSGNNSGSNALAYIYDPASNQWTQTVSAPYSVGRGSMSTLSDGRVLLAEGSSTKTPKAYIFKLPPPNAAPVVTVSSSGNKLLSAISGHSLFTIKGKVSDEEGDSVKVSATVGGVTKSITVSTPPTTTPASDNWTLTWDVASDNIPESVTNGFDIKAEDATGSGKATYSGIITIDRTPPSLTPVSIVSNGPNPKEAKFDDVITLTMTSSETLNGVPVVTINGHSAVVSSTGGNSYKATYIVLGTDPMGPVSISILATDLAGNVGQASNTTDGSSVTITIPPLVLTPDNGTYKIKSGDILTITANDPNTIKTAAVTGGSSSDNDNIKKSLEAYLNSSYLSFDNSFLDLVKPGTYFIVLTANSGQAKTYTLKVLPPDLQLSSTSGSYTQESGISISVLNITQTTFTSVDKTFVSINSSNKNEALFNAATMDTLNPGNYDITFVDSYGSSAKYTLTVNPSIAPVGFSPDNGTYVVGSGTPLSTSASKAITTITSDKLVSGDYTINGKLLTFNSSRLDGIPAGTYVIKAVLSDNSIIQYTLKVVDNRVVTDRCTANLYSFNKNTDSSEYQDYEITCSVPILSVEKLTFGSSAVSASDYFTVGTSLVVDKKWIAKLPDNQYRVSFDYNGSRSVIFYLDVSSEIIESETDAQVPC